MRVTPATAARTVVYGLLVACGDGRNADTGEADTGEVTDEACSDDECPYDQFCHNDVCTPVDGRTFNISWIECHETSAGDCPDVAYPMFAERAAGTWTLSTLSTAPPSLVATSVGWTDLNDPAVLYATEGAGAWRGVLSW